MSALNQLSECLFFTKMTSFPDQFTHFPSNFCNFNRHCVIPSYTNQSFLSNISYITYIGKRGFFCLYPVLQGYFSIDANINRFLRDEGIHPMADKLPGLKPILILSLSFVNNPFLWEDSHGSQAHYIRV